MTIRRCQAGFVLNSQGWGSCFIVSVSRLSSIMPLILQYPPSGSHPIPYSVSHPAALGQILVNHFPLVLKSLRPPMSKNRKNLSTLMPNSFAHMKCPSSWIRISIERASITCSAFMIATMSYLLLSNSVTMPSARSRASLSVSNMSSSDGDARKGILSMHPATMSGMS